MQRLYVWCQCMCIIQLVCGCGRCPSSVGVALSLNLKHFDQDMLVGRPGSFRDLPVCPSSTPDWYRVLRMETVLMLARQTLCPRSYLPSTHLIYGLQISCFIISSYCTFHVIINISCFKFECKIIMDSNIISSVAIYTTF